MRLSDGEKLILFMLAEACNKLGVKGEIDPNFIKSAISGGHLWALRLEYDGFILAPDIDQTVADEVIDILDMWASIEFAHAKMGEEERQKLDSLVSHVGSKCQFPGFDGNNEAMYLSVAKFLVNELGRFEEFRGRDLNCHSLSLEGYRRMLVVFTPLRPSLDGVELSVEQVAKILNAR